jgi:hypothetical protein
VTQCRLLASSRRFEQPTGPIFRGQEFQIDLFLDCLALENGMDRLYETSGTNQQSTLRNITEDIRSDLHRGRSVLSLLILMLHCHEGLEWFQRLVSVDISTPTYFLPTFRFTERTEPQSVLS